MSKSTSSLSFGTQSSTSMTNSSADDSNDLNESFQNLSHHRNDKMFKISNRRRRKRTIFTATDIEYLKEAFIQNPKPTRK